MKNTQFSMFDQADVQCTPMVVDGFAGGGGASTGIEMALGRPVSVAINHDESAILMHQMNHPNTRHYKDNIWMIDPRSVTGGRPVGLAWFSPDCKHFSRAKGAALVDRNIRGLAWVVCKWAALARPTVIMMENVPEFVTWGPVRKGKPVKSKSGQTFRKWRSQLEDLGYKIEYRTLCAADYGAPTIRTRFCLIARCDGRPIQWPVRTHAPIDSIEVKNGLLKPWKPAADIIDWSLPTYSIFESKQALKDKFGITAVRPLADKTLARIANGLDKFVLSNAEPFIMCNNAQNQPHGLDEPVPTITTGNRNFLCVPYFVQYHNGEAKGQVRGQEVNRPLLTLDTSNRYGLVSPFLTQYFGTGLPQSVERPLNTITAKDRENVCVPLLAHFKGKDKGQPTVQPMMTITAADGQFGEVCVALAKCDTKQELGFWPQVRNLLNAHTKWKVKPDEILLLKIDESLYFISDIGLRMLTPRELYRAMGFPADYIIDVDSTGKAISRKDQVARCGNAVCPPLAEALVRANLPEWCQKEAVA